jgi:hypothetical protein
MRNGRASIITGRCQDAGPLPFLQEALTIAKFETGIYEVVRAFAPVGEPD